MRSATTACERALALAVVLATTACEIATGGAFASTGIGAGASVGDDGENGSSTSSDDEVGKTDDGADDLPKPGVQDDTSSSGDDDTSTGDATTTGDAETSTTAADSESESSSGDAAVEPWSACLGGGCGDGMVCMSAPMQEGVCTQACMPANDATSCAPAPGGLDTTCIALEGSSWCAIDCSFGECPGGTDCFVVADDHSAAQICL